MRNFWIVLALLALMLIGGQARDDEPTPSTSAAQVPVTAPAEVGTLETLPAEPAVPLAISETSTPPGWAPPPPPMPEEEILTWLGQGWDAIKWQLAGMVFILLFLLVAVIMIEKTRHD